MMRQELNKKHDQIDILEHEKSKMQQKLLEYNQIDMNYKVLKSKYEDAENIICNRDQLIEQKNGDILAKDTNIREYDDHVQRLINIVSRGAG